MKRCLFAVGIVVASVLAVTGCSGLRSREAATVSYVLRPAAGTGSGPVAEVATPTAGSATVKIVRVLAQPGYAGDRILLLGADRSLGFFAASRWVDTLPALVGTLAVESLRDSGALRAVYDDAAPFAADYALRLTIRRFDAEYPAAGGAPRVTVSLECTLGRRADRSTVASFRVEAQAKATDDRMSDVVAAFEQAAQQALAAMVQQTRDALTRTPAAQSLAAPVEPPPSA